MSKISIIVPVYNAEKYLRRCLDSIVMQTYDDWELLLIDDGSLDQSGIICDEYAAADSRIKVFHKDNGGVSSARNIGIDNATSEWIVFVDSDDYVEAEYLEDFAKFFSMVDYKTMVLQGIVKNTEHTFHCKGYADGIFSKGKIAKCIIDNDLLNFGCPYSKLYNRVLIKELDLFFPKTYSYGEDTVFFLRYLSGVESLILDSSCNYHYMDSGGGSLSRKGHSTDNLLAFLEDNIRAIRLLDNQYQSNGLLIASHRNSINGILKKILMDMWRLNYDYKDKVRSYKNIRSVISKLSCGLYSSMTIAISVVPPALALFLINVILKYK